MSGDLWKTLIYNGETFDKFEVSMNGKIRNSKTHKILKTCVNKEGYEQICVSLGSRNKKKVFKIHKAIAETFVPNLENKPEVNHKNGDKLKNDASNLEWTTSSENMKHAADNGLLHPKRGIDNVLSKLTTDDVRYIREYYIPYDSVYGARALGRKFNVAHSTILDVLNNASYVNV